MKLRKHALIAAIFGIRETVGITEGTYGRPGGIPKNDGKYNLASEGGEADEILDMLSEGKML
jgi:hypothetical protein